MHDAADDPAIVRSLDAPDIRRQVRFDPIPLLIAQPKQVAAHDASPSKNESGSYCQSAKLMSSDPSRGLDGKASGVAESCNHGRPLRNEFCRECRQAVCFAISIADIEGDVTAFDITKRLHVGAQRLRESSAGLARKNEKNAEDRHRRLLRTRRQRPSNSRRAAEQSDELAAVHSITSSAIASSLSGTFRPSALAVRRLITNSNRVGCSTGRSAGFAPLKILCTSVAARRYRSG